MKLKFTCKTLRITEYLANINSNIVISAVFDANYLSTKKALELLESIQNGLPIGEVIGGNKLFEADLNSITKKAATKSYTLLSLFLNPELAKQYAINNQYSIVYNLDKEKFETTWRKLKPHQIPVYKLLDSKAFYSYQRTATAEYADRYLAISKTIQDYPLNLIYLNQTINQ